MKFLIFISFISLIRVSCVPIDKAPIDVEYFKDGQILLPNYSCSDTLIVNNAKELNKAVAYIEQGIIDDTDYNMDSLFHAHSTVK
jgi:hypothetical protein